MWVWAEAVKITRVESVAQIKGTEFCASILAPIRLQDIRPNVILAAFFEPDVARSFCTCPRVADTLFKFDAANASQAFCNWHLRPQVFCMP